MNPEFTLEAAYKRWLAPDELAVDTVLTVGCDSAGTETEAPELAEVIVIDRSGSMFGAKLAEAKRAAASAVDTVRDGARFAVVAGDHHAVPCFPVDGTLATADEQNRAAAKHAIEAIGDGGTTAIGKWLRLAADILATAPDAIGHVQLLTDGIVTQFKSEYEADLAYCGGRFVCDSVGIGQDWRPTELADLAERFQGSFVYCADLSDLAAHFVEVCERLMDKAVDRVELRLLGPVGTELVGMQQMVPFKLDMRRHLGDAGDRQWVFRTAAWGTEQRQYLLTVRFAPTEPGKGRGLRVRMASGSTVLADTAIQVKWTDEPSLFLAVDPEVAAMTGQGEVSGRLLEGMRAWRENDIETATRAIDEAYRKAEAGGFDGLKGAIGQVAEYDPTTRSVKLRLDVDLSHVLGAESDSYRMEPSRTVTRRKGEQT